MTTLTEFQIGKHGILMIGGNFKSWFYGMSFTLPVKSGVFGRQTIRAMTDAEIISELKITWTTLGQIIYILDFAPDQLTKEMSHYNVFYIKDKHSEVRSVSLLWTDEGWIVEAFSTQRPEKWIGGFRFFSKSIAPTLATRIELLEKRVTRLETLLVV